MKIAPSHIWRVPKFAIGAIWASCILILASCTVGDFGSPPPGDPGGTASRISLPAIGSGPTRVALLLPFSASGNAGTTSQAMKQAAQMALSETNDTTLTILPKDTQGTAQGAQLAAQEAIGDGAELIIGPLFATSVSAVGHIARRSAVPVIAFSTDASVAGRGVYLLSFLPENDISTIVQYAGKRGKRALAALLPENAYGRIAEKALRQAADRAGVQVVAIAHYPLDRRAMNEPAKRIAALATGPRPQVDTILVPDGKNVIPTLVPLLTINGVSTKKTQLLGSGQWSAPQIQREPSVASGWYPSPGPSGWASFSARFAGAHGTKPPRVASLAYDATSLAAALARQPGRPKYTPNQLTNPNGFSGIDGIFRFLTNGQNERGLAVLQVKSGGGSNMIQAAPNSFTGR